MSRLSGEGLGVGEPVHRGGRKPRSSTDSFPRLESEGTGRHRMAHVDFGEAGVKRLLLRVAPLVKL